MVIILWLFFWLSHTLRDTFMSSLYLCHILYVLSETPDAVHSYTEGIMLICAPWVHCKHKWWSYFLFFTDITRSIRSVSVCLRVQEFSSSGDCAHHKVVQFSSRHVPPFAYTAQAGRRTRVSSRAGRHVIGLQLLNEISSWVSAVHLLSAGTDWGS